jgi:hypothetical protein
VDTQAGSRNSAAALAAARADARRLGIGWVVVWPQSAPIARYLTQTGFRLDYRVDGVWVYRPASALAPQTDPAGRGYSTPGRLGNLTQ